MNVSLVRLPITKLNTYSHLFVYLIEQSRNELQNHISGNGTIRHRVAEKAASCNIG